MEKVHDDQKVLTKALNAEIVEKYVLDGSPHGIVEYELEKASEIIYGEQ